MTAPIASAWKIIPTFESKSIQRTLDFYVDFLGFELGGVKPEDGPSSDYTFCSIFAGDKAAANIYFFKPDGDVKPGLKIEANILRILQLNGASSTEPRINVVKDA
ncbi:hypothetical protein FOBRF1_010630 [Fusarium oxysporum]